VAMVEGFDCLLEADGDEQPDADGGDVDEEVRPGVDGFVGRVDVEHGRSFAALAEMRREAAMGPMLELRMSVSQVG